MAKSGATLEEIARAVGTTRKNLYRWASRFDEFRHILKTAGVEADDRVELTLYQRAVGYEVKTEKIFKDGDGSIIRVETTEHIPPDVTAQIFWLKNRRRDKWSERNQQFAGAVTINLTAEDLAGAGVKTIEHSPAETVEPVNV